MKFKGTIIITDPCYLDSGNEYLKKKFSDWVDETCECEVLSEIGFTSYISESTIYGDWSCFTYKGLKESAQVLIDEWDKYYFDFIKRYNSELNEEEKDNMLSEYETYSSKFFEKNTLGKFCADAGMVCVVYLKDVLKFNPNFEEWAKTHPWCATIIEDFDGDINYEVDENGEAHIVGIGNINFYTSQSEL